ncbi:DUF2935 domain-containing protein [Clostridium lundense]|uniref:DUF2935 domain-containing protein n=1 Tax=Clostridium lundense TaxID=319475 RepID=UPI0006851A4E|nr:DUF2935 domain-containing protein [Clostridium lundense]
MEANMMNMYNYPMMEMCNMCMYKMCCPMLHAPMNMMPMYPMCPESIPMFPMYGANMEEEILLPNMRLMRELIDDMEDKENLDEIDEEYPSTEESQINDSSEAINPSTDNIESNEAYDTVLSNDFLQYADEENTFYRSENKNGRKTLYCYTSVNNLNCVFNELMLWTDISSEHPIFIKTVATLTKKNLPKEIENRLMEVNKMFSNLNKKVVSLRKKVTANSIPLPNVITELNKFIKEFFKYDEFFLGLLSEIKSYGKEDKVWQTLLNHITHEQKFMYELFQNIDNQI